MIVSGLGPIFHGLHLVRTQFSEPIVQRLMVCLMNTTDESNMENFFDKAFPHDVRLLSLDHVPFTPCAIEKCFQQCSPFRRTLPLRKPQSLHQVKSVPLWDDPQTPTTANLNKILKSIVPVVDPVRRVHGPLPHPPRDACCDPRTLGLQQLDEHIEHIRSDMGLDRVSVCATSGVDGVGKSTMLRLACEHFVRSAPTGVVRHTFYFSFNDPTP